jgi:hypothetical protein
MAVGARPFDSVVGGSRSPCAQNSNARVALHAAEA